MEVQVIEKIQGRLDRTTGLQINRKLKVATYIESGIAYGLGKKCYAIGEYHATDNFYNIFDEIFINETELEEFLKKYSKN